MNRLGADFSNSWSSTIAKLVSIITIIISASVLVGWILFYWISKDYIPIILAFKPNAAICFILIGIALWFSCENKVQMQPVIKIASGIVFLIGFLTLFEYFFNINLSIDEFLFKDPYAERHLLPGRMTPLTAMNFVLLGFILFFLDNKIINYRIYSTLILIMLVTSSFEFLFHIYLFASGVTEKNLITQIMLQTTFISSFLFISLNFGILLARPNRGAMSVLISKNNSGLLARRLIPPVILLPIIFGYIFIVGRNEITSVFLVSAIVLTTSIFISTIILINAYIINREEVKTKRNALDLKQFQTLSLKSANAGTWSWNIKKNIFVCDKHLQQLFGVKLDNFPSRFEAIFNFIHPKDRRRFDDEIKSSLKYHSEHESEFRVFHPDGSIHNLATRGHIFRDHSGNPIKMAGICWDVTQRKKVEAELRQAKEKAEKLAEDAGEANRAKSAFLAAMSHEIRTPLNGIMGTMELLYDTSLSKEQRDLIGTVRSSGEDLLTIINDIIDYSKIESGRFEFEYHDFNLQNLIDDTVEKIVSQIQEKGLLIDAVLDPQLPEWFNGDSSRIRQILSNLLNNAVKFTEKGSISIRIQLQPNQNQKKTQEYNLLFEIIDTGIGITPEVNARLFKPFSQGDFSDKRKHGGIGLGLIISKRLVELLNGSIGVDSAYGVGSRFWFNLPLKPSSIKTQEKQYKILEEFSNTHILCVDDNPISRKIMERQIKSWGLQVNVSPSADHALSCLIKASTAKKPYDLALIDYAMPIMDGLELIKIIRHIPEIDKTNIIILSPTGASFGLEEMKNLRIMMCLTKPLNQIKLYDGVTTALKMIRTNEQPSFLNNLEENKNVNILLAEDNETNRQVALKILSKLGYKPDIASNGIEVLEAIKTKKYDLILMDCQMPEMDGYKAAQEIRKLEANSDHHIFIIAMTAHALKGDRQKCLQHGMDDYVSKPIEISVLASTLQRWLGGIALSRKADSIPTSKIEKTESTLDMNRIKDIFGNDMNEISQFLQTFIASTSALLHKINEAIHNKDQSLSKNLFHQLKGSAGNSGVPKIQELSLKAEDKVQELDWDGVLKFYHLIIDVFDKTTKEIETVTKNL